MKVVLFVILFYVLHISVEAWVGIIPYDKNSSHNHEGYCYDEKIGALQLHETKRIRGSCYTATCEQSKDISLTGCGVASVSPPCYVTSGDLSKPFPKCCFKVICPEDMRDEEDRLNKNLI